ncbi:MoaD/ThiS family protein [Xanthomonas sp. MUS 060]|uniref:MoaD/ThiS family protein n=1 Tax=Xanthomonas sp. MUS 060 TaxID=1588031 RepID=UPI001F307E65|nr:MoaD/ThiS family protein [Xanthomonas sp. MUS 060]
MAVTSMLRLVNQAGIGMYQQRIENVETASGRSIVKVMVPTAMRRFTGQQAFVEVEADDVGQALRAAVRAYPSLLPQLFAADGSLRRFINVFVNASDIRMRQGQGTPLVSSDVIVLVPAIAGG